MSEAPVVAERRGSVGWLRLNRPEALNALDEKLVEQLDEHLTVFESDPGVRAIVLTGTGRAFCAGGDLGSFTAGEPSREMTEFLRKAAHALEHLPAVDKPVIAAVNGTAAAGGLEIALACDIVIAAQGARMGDAHINYGLIPGGGGAVRLARVVGPTRAKYLALTGDLLPARVLADWGVVNEVVDEEELEERAQQLGLQLAGKSPLALAATKRLIDDSFDQSLDTALRAERVAVSAHMRTDDLREGLQAFEEKRPPVFRGR